MGTMLRNDFLDLHNPAMDAIFYLAYNRYPLEYPDLFNMKTSTKRSQKLSHVSSLGLIPKKNESAAVTFDSLVQGFDSEVIHDTYAMAYRISQENIEDELTDIFKRLPEALGVSMRITREQDGANQFNRAFNSSYTGPDGKELLATDHPLIAGGGTQKNELTNVANLSKASLEQAFIDIAATVDDNGKQLYLRPKTLWVGPALESKAKELIYSPGQPESSNLAINPRQNALDVKVNHFFTSATAWLITCEEHQVFWYDRIMPEHSSGNDFDTGDLKAKIRARWSRAWGQPWGWFGSPGA